MKKKSIYDEIFDKPCAVCGKVIKKDIYDQGDCPYCNWRNNFYADEHPDIVIYPNLISLNKAKQLYKEGKPFEPNLDEFIEALYCYCEVQFEYNGVYYGVERLGTKDNRYIAMFKFNEPISQTFQNKEDFKNNAKVEDKFLKDIWDKTTDRYWLQ